MKVLIVANHNKGDFVTFITEQVESLRSLGVEIDYYGVHGKGTMGYLSNLSSLKAKIRAYKPDLIHAHYGLSGLLANLQRQVPVVTTYHGSDIHSGGKILFFSRLAIWLSKANIFVTKQLLRQAGCNEHKVSVIACGIDANLFHPIEREEARRRLGWDQADKYVLFAGAFDNNVKNSPLAKAAVALLPNVKLIEMRGYNREQVCLAMNASNCLLLTSFREGSPMVIKEAMSCGVPIVSVDVGNVIETTEGVEGVFITSRDKQDIANNIQKAFAYKGKTNGRQAVIDKGFTIERVAEEVLGIYKNVLARK